MESLQDHTGRLSRNKTC